MVIAWPALPNPADWFAHHQASRPTTRRQHIGQWTLEIIHDPFAGAIHCKLRARAMTYGPVAITFQLGSRTNTFEAMYKVDQAPAVSWRVNAMVLAANGVTIQSEDLNNPSGGRVIVPLTVLAGAQTVSIRTSPRAGVRTFTLGDLPGALQAAQTAGCGPGFSAGDGK